MTNPDHAQRRHPSKEQHMNREDIAKAMADQWGVSERKAGQWASFVAL